MYESIDDILEKKRAAKYFAQCDRFREGIKKILKILCELCPHQDAEHSMNCHECCPVPQLAKDKADLGPDTEPPDDRVIHYLCAVQTSDVWICPYPKLNKDNDVGCTTEDFCHYQRTGKNEEGMLIGKGCGKKEADFDRRTVG